MAIPLPQALICVVQNKKGLAMHCCSGTAPTACSSAATWPQWLRPVPRTQTACDHCHDCSAVGLCDHADPEFGLQPSLQHGHPPSTSRLTLKNGASHTGPGPCMHALHTCPHTSRKLPVRALLGKQYRSILSCVQNDRFLLLLSQSGASQLLLPELAAPLLIPLVQ